MNDPANKVAVAYLTSNRRCIIFDRSTLIARPPMRRSAADGTPLCELLRRTPSLLLPVFEAVELLSVLVCGSRPIMMLEV